MAQKTAVECLADEIGYNLLMWPNDTDWMSGLVEKAKQMEKEQKIEFAKHCLNKAVDLDIRTAYSGVEKYYNEKYGTE